MHGEVESTIGGLNQYSGRFPPIGYGFTTGSARE